MTSATEKTLRRLIQSHFRGSQPRITRVRPAKGSDFAVQVRVIRPRSLGQFLTFSGVLEQRHPDALLTFQGTVRPTVEIVFQIHAVTAGE